ncbi:MAG: FkbM family methyltransferase [bacterium]
MKEEVSQNFTNVLNFSRKTILQRFISRPFYVIYKVLISKFYNLLFANKPFFVSEKTFWGDKMKMVLPEDASLFHWGMVPGEEENLTRYMIQTVQEGWVVIDIGANHGYYSLLLSKLVGRNGKVYCFEPTPSTTKILKENTEKKENVIVEQKAIWSKNEKLDFTDYGQGFSAYNSFLPNVDWKDTEKPKSKINIQVDGIVLDNYLKFSKIRPDFIKLDVEGAELDALIGMRATLIACTPIISVEFWVNSLWSNRNDEILSFFEKINYSVFRIDGKGITNFFKENAHFEHDYTNLVFISKK